VPILPVSVCCGQRFFDNFPRRTSVTITIADPIYPQGEDDALALTDKLMFTLSQNLPVEFRGVYSEIPSVFLPSWENANKD
jgi:hypothetical protein